MAITDWSITDYPEFLYNFESNSGSNVFGFRDEEYDYLVYLAKHEILESKQLEYFDKMQSILFDKLPMLGLYFETSTVFYTKDFGEQLKPQINNILNNYISRDEFERAVATKQYVDGKFEEILKMLKVYLQGE